MGKPANGQAPTNALVQVQSGTYAGHAYTIYLESATAAAYNRAKAAGGLSIAPPLGGYRSLTDQANLKNNPASWGSSLPSSKIAAPGHSTHGYGDCVDIYQNNTWFQTHCGEYGFVRESPAGENNHYRFKSPTWATPIAANQRQVKSTALANIRNAPQATADDIGDVQPNQVITPLGYVTGGSVSNISTWYVLAKDATTGKATQFTWAGGYTDSSTNNIPAWSDPAPGQRTAVKDGAKRRSKPYVDASTEVSPLIAPNATVTFKGYVQSPLPDGSRIDTVADIAQWFVNPDGTFSHPSAFTNTSVTDLPDLSAQLFPKPVEPAPAPAEPAEGTFWFADISENQGVMDWSKYTLPAVALRSSTRLDDLTLKKDVQFDTNLAAARAKGLPIWFYHYKRGTTIEDAQSQAAFMLSTIGTLQDNESIVLDDENEPTINVDYDIAFAKAVKLATNKNIIVYSNSNRFSGQDTAKMVVAGIQFWVASYGANNGEDDGTTVTANGQPVLAKQYTSAATGAAYGASSTGIDLNVFYGTTEQFANATPVAPVEEPTEPTPVPTPEEPEPEPTPDPEEPTTPTKPTGNKVLGGVVGGSFLVLILGFFTWLFGQH